MKKMLLEFKVPDDFEIGHCPQCPFRRGNDQCILEDYLTNGSCKLNCFCRLQEAEKLDNKKKNEFISETISKFLPSGNLCVQWNGGMSKEEVAETVLNQATEQVIDILEKMRVD